MPDGKSNSGSDHFEGYPYDPQSPTLPIPVPREVPPWLSLVFLRPLTIALAIVFMGGNIAIWPLINVFNSRDWSAGWIYLLFGSILAQGALLSFRLVFGEGAFWRRTISFWIAGLILCGCWALGLALTYNDPGPTLGEVCGFVALSLPLVALAIQTPLWFARGYLGWRLEKSNVIRAQLRPLSIGDYLVGTAVFALSLTLARLATPASWMSSIHWPMWAATFASFAMGSSVTVIPTMVMMFGFKDWRIGFFTQILLSTFGTLVVITALDFCSARLRGDLSLPDPMDLAGFGVAGLGYSSLLGLGMKAMRDVGFSLVLGRIKGS